MLVSRVTLFFGLLLLLGKPTGQLAQSESVSSRDSGQNLLAFVCLRHIFVARVVVVASWTISFDGISLGPSDPSDPSQAGNCSQVRAEMQSQSRSSD